MTGWSVGTVQAGDRAAPANGPVDVPLFLEALILGAVLDGIRRDRDDLRLIRQVRERDLAQLTAPTFRHGVFSFSSLGEETGIRTGIRMSAGDSGP